MKQNGGEGDSPMVTFDWAAIDSPSGATVTAVATVSDTAPTELPPLHRDVDSDGLDALLARMRTQNVPGRVAFEYCDYRLILTADGEGRIYETNGTT